MNKRKLQSILFLSAGVLIVAGVTMQFVYHVRNSGWLYVAGILIGFATDFIKRNKKVK